MTEGRVRAGDLDTQGNQEQRRGDQGQRQLGMEMGEWQQGTLFWNSAHVCDPRMPELVPASQRFNMLDARMESLVGKRLGTAWLCAGTIFAESPAGSNGEVQAQGRSPWAQVRSP